MDGKINKPNLKTNITPTTANSDLNSVSDCPYKYECPICINWLNEAVLTSCGHRFCKICIESWIKNQNSCCPLDNKPLTGTNDIFPDNFTRREISQMKNACPNASAGCKFMSSPLLIDKHLLELECQFQQQSQNYVCPFSKLGCSFAGKTDNELKTHIRNEMAGHLNFLMIALNRTKLLSEIDMKRWDAPSKTVPAQSPSQQNGGIHNAEQMHENLIEAMYKRIVVLEQKSREQESKIERLNRELSSGSNTPQLRFNGDVDPRYSNGIIIWELAQFSHKVNLMLNNPNELIYSKESYTFPYGYKFCARVNIPPKAKEYISLHVHMMQSENDFHLDWPFQGRIKISMVHPKDQSLSQHDTIMSKPEILAFHQPAEAISPRGFGFLEYANISDILRKGFIANDKLIFKVQMNIV